MLCAASADCHTRLGPQRACILYMQFGPRSPHTPHPHLQPTRDTTCSAILVFAVHFLKAQ